MIDISVVIRTFNEERYLGELLSGISKQELGDLTFEVVLVDSGSTDGTVEVAESHGCRIVRICKDRFTFGRSLNVGCEAAQGSVLVFVSGHCVPASSRWLVNLTKPIRDGTVAYGYGSQIGRDTTKFSERQVFAKYFDPSVRTPQSEYFVNNANAALAAEFWLESPFDEEISGLEDMHLARQLLAKGLHVGYVQEAPVYHIHDETWRQVMWRYEREALALQQIDPSLHMSRRDLVRCIASSIYLDFKSAANQDMFTQVWSEIIAFRVCQYWGSYSGSRASRKLNQAMKRRYFYPE